MDKAPSAPARVVSLALSGDHAFSKQAVERVKVIQGIGVEGDAHAGEKVQHLSRVKANPDQPNLRQVHLIHTELFEELQAKGFAVGPADLGENIATAGIALLELPRGAVLRIGPDVELEVTGLRNPCAQIEAFHKGLMAAVLDRGADGELVRKAGVMSVVLSGGEIAVGDLIEVRLPPEPHQPLAPV
jgi:MOSC domain-containing protein YiiM